MGQLLIHVGNSSKVNDWINSPMRSACPYFSPNTDSLDGYIFGWSYNDNKNVLTVRKHLASRLVPTFAGLLYILVSYISITINQVNAQTWKWTRTAEGVNNYNDIGSSVSTDSAGNVYLAGTYYSPTITFGTTTFTNAGYGNIFLVKYDAAGTLLWAKSAGGTYYDMCDGVSTDAAGNVYLTGRFASPTMTFGTTTLTSAGHFVEVFLVKCDAAGNVLWARSGGGKSWDYGHSVSADAAGNVYLTGLFASSTVTFETVTLTNADASGNNPDMFLLKYDAAGNLLWAKSAGGNSWDTGNRVSSDSEGNVYVTGSFASPFITFGTKILANADNTGNTNDIFLVKYDAAGNLLWAKSAGSPAGDEGLSVSTDTGDNVYWSGSFGSPSISFESTTLTNMGGADIFLVKYDTSGALVWANSEGGISHDVGSDVSTDVKGNVYMTGSFWSPSITLGTTTLTNAGISDIFVVKYDPAGNVLWVNSAGGESWDGGLSVSSAPGSMVYIAGYYRSSLITFGTTTLASTGKHDVLLAGLDGDIITEVKEWPNKERFVFYPNPFCTQGILQTDILLNNATLIIYNTFGKAVKQVDHLSGHTIFLSRDNLPAGVYFVRLAERNNLGTYRDILVTKLMVSDDLNNR